MYDELIEQLKLKGVTFDQGLSNKEIMMIEAVFNIRFPLDLKAFYQCALPVSEGFYNWRDLSESNIKKIDHAIMTPIIDFKQDVDCISWSDAWGEEPDNAEVRNALIIAKIDSAAKLIPVFGHRYISSQFDEGNPVFSICDLDIIYYGENLMQYFYIEFKYKKHSEIDYSAIKEVDFWSDLLSD